jgi:hypothetical protein
MGDKMTGGGGFRFVIGLVLVVALILGAAAIGYAAYTAGITQGAAIAGGASAIAVGAPAVVPAYAPYGPMMYPYGYPHFGFGFLGCLVPLFFLFVVFGVFRFVVRGGMWGHRHGGWGPKGFMRDDMRAQWMERAEEWHRKQHGEGGEAKA